ncbi:MAG: hypothetical protein HY537_09805 [Deltaproteobacteria bacterium]|nr:hypothetical protein [Deltaproteobacteria bacterium]
MSSLSAFAQTDRDRLETYELLLQLYDGNGQNLKAIRLLEKWLSEIKAGKFTLKKEQIIELHEKLAERYTWNSQALQALNVLQSFEVSRLSPLGRAIKIISLDELGREDEARSLATSLRPDERVQLPQATLRRLSDLEGRTRTISSVSLPTDSLTADQNDFRTSHVSSILDAPQFMQVASRVITTSEQTLPSLECEMHLGKKNLPHALLLRTSISQALPSSSAMGFLRAGHEYRTHSLRTRAEFGYQGGGSYFPLQIVGDVSGKWLLFDYASAYFDLAKVHATSQGLVSLGVTETRLGTYWERRFSSWIEATGDFVLRSTHLGHTLNQGRGIEGTARVGLGPAPARWRLGPWFYFLRWGTDSAALRPLLVSQYTIGGIFGSIDWGANDPFSWRGKITGGIGGDFSSAPISSSLFFEATAEKILSKDFGLKLEYALYTSQFVQTFSNATQLIRLNFVKEL